MAGEGALSEAVLRLEHKVDLVLELLARLAGPDASGSYILTPVGSDSHTCPVCTKPVQYLVDFMNRIVTRQCSCATGKVPPLDLGLFAPPVVPATTEETDGSANEENRSNPDRRGRNRGR